MKIIRSSDKLYSLSKSWHNRNLSIALVPTMGYLHDGHLSLLTLAKQNADKVIVSIFVNPTQFGENEDLDTYPRDFARDELACKNAGADAIFYPEEENMYFADHSSWVDESQLSATLCGASRPGHFRGVCTVVLKLFNISACDYAVFGLKDAQQALVIQRMVRDLNVPVKLLFAPLHREEDGLAMSSRNKYLNSDERKNALAIYRGLQKAEKLYNSGYREAPPLIESVTSEIIASGGKIDYVQIMNRNTLRSIEVIDCPALLAVAAFYGKTRLIDNIFLG